MSRRLQPSIASLFLAESATGPTQAWSWRLIRRRRRPFLLLPLGLASTRRSLELYSPQRGLARMARAALPLLLRTPAALLFQRLTYPVQAEADFLRFLSEQAGLPCAHLPAPAIKFGGLEPESFRLVFLLCDQTQRPLKIIKVGLDAGGRAATDREAAVLERLPDHTPGCARITGRFTTANISAFATDFFPGESPADDAGMESLFHSWLNAGPVVALESLPVWQDLESVVARAAPADWAALRFALAGQSLHSTLYHGDFAPWNIRAINSRNLRAFDWERGQLHGIPGWDWFHFIVQTAILVRRLSAERTAAEVEALLASPRFEKYAAAAGMSAIVRPLLLAYLLHHRWQVRPLEGGRQIEELYDVLAARWGYLRRMPGRVRPPLIGATRPGLWAEAGWQLRSAWAQLANVWWEPTLTVHPHSPLSAQWRSDWPLILFCSGWLLLAALVQYALARHLTLLPLYTLPCLLAAWSLSRPWAALLAGAAALLGPVVALVKAPSAYSPSLVGWNLLMRFILLQLCVFLVDRIRRHAVSPSQLVAPPHRPARWSTAWAVVAASGLGFVLIAWGDIYTGPQVSFLPLYLPPAILLTLFLSLRWGALLAGLGALVSSIDEFASHYDTSAEKAFAWNLPMRFLMLFLVILLIDRLRRENVLFPLRPTPRADSPAPPPAKTECAPPAGGEPLSGRGAAG